MADIGSMWKIGYEPSYCCICGEFAGYKPTNLKFPVICSFLCADKFSYLNPTWHSIVLNK